MTDIIPLHPRRPGATSPAVAAALRDALERMIEAGVDAGFVSGESMGQLLYEAVPPLFGFLRGHVAELHDALENSNQGDAE